MFPLWRIRLCSLCCWWTRSTNSFKEASVTFQADKITLLMRKLKALPAGSADIDRMNAKLRGVVRAGAATSRDLVLLHTAACGDQAARSLVMKSPEEYIHKVAIAEYVSLLAMILEKRPDFIECSDPSTGRTPLINAA